MAEQVLGASDAAGARVHLSDQFGRPEELRAHSARCEQVRERLVGAPGRSRRPCRAADVEVEARSETSAGAHFEQAAAFSCDRREWQVLAAAHDQLERFESKGARGEEAERGERDRAQRRRTVRPRSPRLSPLRQMRPRRRKLRGRPSSRGARRRPVEAPATTDARDRACAPPRTPRRGHGRRRVAGGGGASVFGHSSRQRRPDFPAHQCGNNTPKAHGTRDAHFDGFGFSGLPIAWPHAPPRFSRPSSVRWAAVSREAWSAPVHPCPRSQTSR